MICIVLALGAPVIDAQGNIAAKISARPAVLAALTQEVICQRVGYRWTRNKSLTCTLPARAIRPRSFRIMSTIMAFSARFFAEDANSTARARSSSYQRPRAIVPFIGREMMRSPSSSKNSSGDAEQIAKSAVSK